MVPASMPVNRRKLSIGIDLHDVIAAWAQAIIDLHGWPDRMTGRVWDWYYDGRGEGGWNAWFDSEDYAGFLERLSPVYGAGDGLVALLRRFDVTIISAAPATGPGWQATWNWIYRAGKLPLDISPYKVHLVALDNIDNKIHYIKESAYAFDWLIDDMGVVLEAAHQAGINTARFVTPWNASQASNIHVRNWKDIRKFFLDGSPDPGAARSKWLTLTENRARDVEDKATTGPDS